MSNTTHEIISIANLIDLVSVDNIEELRTDLGNFLEHVLIAKTLYTAAAGEPATARSLNLVSLTWTQDGKGECSTVMQADTHKEGDPQLFIKSKPNR